MRLIDFIRPFRGFKSKNKLKEILHDLSDVVNHDSPSLSIVKQLDRVFYSGIDRRATD